ncbi:MULTISPECIES: hypothetical protein [Pseudoalteromonas]|nr:hypothetical protein [Pseudoalteromonas sp. S3431]
MKTVIRWSGLVILVIQLADPPLPATCTVIAAGVELLSVKSEIGLH